jgi:hypothetical protein
VPDFGHLWGFKENIEKTHAGPCFVGVDPFRMGVERRAALPSPGAVRRIRPLNDFVMASHRESERRSAAV